MTTSNDDTPTATVEELQLPIISTSVGINGDALSEVYTQAAHAAGRQSAVHLQTGRYDLDTTTEPDVHVFVLESGQHIEQVDLARYLPHPARKTGKPTFTDPASFAAYVNRHSDPATTTLWGNVDAGTITAVLDDHSQAEGGYAGHLEHRATLQLEHTPDWVTWVNKDRDWFSQADFAEFVEDNAAALRRPAPADFLAIALTFRAKRNLKFDSEINLQSGAVVLHHEETIGSSAGRKGDIAIPDTFELGLAPFEGGASFPLEARFRYNVGEGRAQFGYRLIRADLVLRAAFDTIVTTVQAATKLDVLHGAPTAR